jgi:hypothetical protein
MVQSGICTNASHLIGLEICLETTGSRVHLEKPRPDVGCISARIQRRHLRRSGQAECYASESVMIVLRQGVTKPATRYPCDSYSASMDRACIDVLQRLTPHLMDKADIMENSGFIGKHLIGPKFDRM